MLGGHVANLRKLLISLMWASSPSMEYLAKHTPRASQNEVIFHTVAAAALGLSISVRYKLRIVFTQ
jgi:hypothetical protein